MRLRAPSRPDRSAVTASRASRGSRPAFEPLAVESEAWTPNWLTGQVSSRQLASHRCQNRSRRGHVPHNTRRAARSGATPTTAHSSHDTLAKPLTMSMFAALMDMPNRGDRSNGSSAAPKNTAPPSGASKKKKKKGGGGGPKPQDDAAIAARLQM